MTIHAIPTRYRGTHYRSRLEAKWAAFFDLCGWCVEYEPVDLNGWIPDFAILEAELVYVEIKPTHLFPGEAAAKIDRADCYEDVLILGNTLDIVPLDDPRRATLFGWLGEWCEEMLDTPEDRSWGEAAIGVWGDVSPGRLGFCHSQQSFHDRITGKYDGGCWGENPASDDAAGQRIREYWREAGNLVQWHPRGGLSHA